MPSGAEQALESEQQKNKMVADVSSAEVQQQKALVAELATTKAHLLTKLAASAECIVSCKI